MEKKRWSLIFIGLCLALIFSVSSVEAQDIPEICKAMAFCDRDMDTYFKDHKRCVDCTDFSTRIDCNDSNGSAFPGNPDELCDGIDNNCNGEVDEGCNGGEEDTKTSKQSIPLIMTFDDMAADNIQSDGMIFGDSLSSYIDNEGVGVSAGGRSQPNPAAGIHMGLRAKPRIMRQLFLDITCEPIEFIDTVIPGIDKCNQLPPVLFDDTTGEPIGYGFLKKYPECEGNNFCDLGAAVRPYKVDCPEGGLPCPDVFTMDPGRPELMSFRLFFGGGLTVEVASAIGADGSQDPGTCLSMLTEGQLDAFLDEHCRAGPNDQDHPGPADCNVEVTAYDQGNEGPFPGDDTGAAGAGDGENDAWRVVADGVTALICDRPGVTVIGKATLTFGFDAIKK